MNGICEVFKYEYEKFKQGKILNIEIKESSIICNEKPHLKKWNSLKNNIEKNHSKKNSRVEKKRLNTV